VHTHLPELFHSPEHHRFETPERGGKKKNDDEERTWSSEHCRNFTMVMLAEERRVVNLDAREISIYILVVPGSEEKRR
jgi:hypothetical protein